MIVCEYEEVVLEKDHRTVWRGEQFRTHSELESHRIIAKWNRLGIMKNKFNIVYAYKIVTIRKAFPTVKDDKIEFITVQDC